MRAAPTSRVGMSVRRGFTIAIALTTLVLGGACACLVWFTNMLLDTTTALGEAVAQNEMAADCRRDRLLREVARSPEMMRRLDTDLERRLAELRAGAVDDAMRAAVDDAAGADAEHVHDALARLEEVARRRVDVARADAERWHRAASVFAASVAGLLVAGAGLLLFGLHRRVVRPLVELSSCMKGFVAGDAAECTVSGAEEIREVARAFNSLSGRLRDQRTAHSTFLAGVAHDLRNPIQVLRTAVDLARQNGPPSGRSGRIVEVLARQLARLERLVGDLLDTTNLEAGQLKLETAEHDLREIVGNVHRLVSIGSEEAEISLCLPSSPLDVSCDGPRIEQVILNLVNNALKYSPGKKAVVIEVTSTGDAATVLVRDSGAGMTEQQMERVFEPFTRASSAEHRVPGHGLGLYLARRIVEQHGGGIRVESAPGKGSSFRVDLPMRPRA